MSGIAGIVDTTERRPVSGESLGAMLRAIAHRGAAGDSVQIKGGVGMGIRQGQAPASPGDRQPFMSADGQLWAMVEGRVFRSESLRRVLEAKGVAFAGRSDAELVAHLYREAGAGCLEKLEGEFSLVVWDGRRRQLFAARDRLGVHHLFYTVQDGVVYFASEIKALLAAGAVTRRMDVKALDQVLFMNCPVAPRTMFEGVSALPAGHRLVVQAGQARHEAYWDLAFPSSPVADNVGEEPYREELLALLREAVRVRMPEDRPVGVYLSGGLDSSAITALMRENGHGRFPAYFSHFNLPAYSEQGYAQLAADALDVPLNLVEMSFQRTAENFPRLIWHGEAPVVLAEAASLLSLAEAASQDVEVVLNGEGGDELLAGYVFNDWDRIYRRLQQFPLSLTLPLIRGLLPRLGYPAAFVLPAEAQRAAREHFGCFPAPLYYNYAVREVTRFYSAEMRAQLREYCPEAEIAGTLNVGEMQRWDPLSQSLYFSTKLNLPNYLLGPHGDRAASSAGIEAYFPFLDQRLMEFAAQVPAGLKVRGREEKYLLKRAMEGLVPDQIVHRRKSPMTAPASPAFLGADAPAYVGRLLSREGIEQTGYFDAEQVAQMIASLRRRDPRQDRNNRQDVMASFPLLGVLSVQILHELFIEHFYEAAPAWD